MLRLVKHLAEHILNLYDTRSPLYSLVHAIAVYCNLSRTYSRFVDEIILAQLPALLDSFPSPTQESIVAFMTFSRDLAATLDSLRFAEVTFLDKLVTDAIFERDSYRLITAVFHIMSELIKVSREEGSGNKAAVINEARDIIRLKMNMNVEGLLSRALDMSGEEEGRDVRVWVASRRVVRGERVWGGEGGGQAKGA
jgi:hypothetical protein